MVEKRLESIGNYDILETVGHGTFGRVALGVERQTRESVAIKVLEREKLCDAEAWQRLENEITILQRVHHPHLLQLLEVIETEPTIYLITEYVGGGELFGHIVDKGRLSEGNAAKLFMQMVSAVDSCHRKLVIHRDLKPENVLLDAAGDIKVIRSTRVSPQMAKLKSQTNPRGGMGRRSIAKMSPHSSGTMMPSNLAARFSRQILPLILPLIFLRFALFS